MLTKLEVIVIWQVNIEDMLIKTVILMLHRNKVILSHLRFTISVTMIAIYFLRS